MNYAGGKNSPGVYQRIISQIPPHRVFVELFGGSAAIARHKRPAERTIVLERDPSTVARFSDGIRQACPGAEIVQADCLRWLSAAWDQVGPDWCLYADPPYHPETLRSEQRYACRFDATDHLRLLAVLKSAPCPVLISGYRHPLYNLSLAAWRRIGYWTFDRAGHRRSESLWMNYPRPPMLHDPRYVGRNRRAREARRRRVDTFRLRVRRADAYELQTMAGELEAELDRRRLEYSAAEIGGGGHAKRNGRHAIAENILEVSLER